MNGEGRAKPKSPEEGEGVTTRVRKTCPDEDADRTVATLCGI